MESCQVVCVGCARMWVVGCCLSGVFWFGLMPLLLFFRGDAVRFFFPFLVFSGWLLFRDFTHLFVGALSFLEINS